uniref:Ribonuclease P protein subunit p29 n=1 Tax=Phallusia mammillata TaxID=59560 RepID=A0A6F9DNP1_9ASCI|nr:ribonuclease P protein subunit p29-like [Phallusia mammillata]
MAKEQERFVESLVNKTIPNFSDKKKDKLLKQLNVKPIMLKSESNSTFLKQKKKSKRKRLGKVIPSRPATIKNCKYKDFGSLRELWMGYIKELLPHNVGKNDEKVIQDLLLKADYHGANIKVVQAKCKDQEGIFGTVLTESKNIFQLITMDDKVVKIPKTNTIFEVQHPDLQITMFGDQFCLRPAHRLTKKFKNYIPAMHLV